MMCGKVRILYEGTRRVTGLVKREARVPSVDCKRGRLSVPRALAARLLFDGLGTTSIAGSAFVASALMLATVALVILCQARSTLTRRAIAFKFVYAVIGNLEFRGLAA